MVIGGIGFWGFGKLKGFAGCMFVYKDVRTGLLKYADEHGGKLPKAETWQDDVREDYRQSMTPKDKLGPIEEPSPDGDWGCKLPDGTMTGMAFNSELSGKKVSDIADQVSTIMIFETEHAGKNLHEKFKARPFETSPIMIGSTRRGWMQAPVSGKPKVVGVNGQETQMDPGGSSNDGINFKVDTSSGKDDK